MARWATAVRELNSAPRRGELVVPHLAGIVLAAVGCALFWVALVAVAAPALGFMPSLADLALIGTLIALFLAAVLRLLPSDY